jgi:hypothetical protein
VGLREEHRARAEVIAADFRKRERFRVARIGVADERHLIAEGLERAERVVRHEREIAAGGFGREQELRGAPVVAAGQTVHLFDADQARPVGRRGYRAGSTGRHHGVEERQRHRRTRAAEKRPAGKLLLSEASASALNCALLGRFSFRIWKHALDHAPRMNEDIFAGGFGRTRSAESPADRIFHAGRAHGPSGSR